jgi:hypothetical protein
VTVRRPVEGEVHVHYGQIYVESDPDGSGPDLAEAFAGQSAGLCGAAVPGALWLTTGLHTGNVGFTVEVHDRAPLLDPAWEDVVEVSFRPASARSSLVEWAGEAAWELDLEETDYRVRYCAMGMDQGRQRDTRVGDEPQRDRYLLQFWPAPPRPDRILKQTAKSAAYWHDYAREQPPPPTPEERAEAERAARLAQERAHRELHLARERWEWGGQMPSEALREVRGNARGLLPFDSALVHALDAAGPAAQRAAALLAARRACEEAGLVDLDWVAAGLGALAEGKQLPSLFDRWRDVWRALESDPRVPEKTVRRAVPPERPPFRPPEDPGIRGEVYFEPVAAPAACPPDDAPGPAAGPGRLLGVMRTRPASPGTPSAASRAKVTTRVTRVGGATETPGHRMSQPHMALPALTGAAQADPLQAALDAVYAAVVTFGEDYPRLLRQVWSALDGAR